MKRQHRSALGHQAGGAEEPGPALPIPRSTTHGKDRAQPVTISTDPTTLQFLRPQPTVGNRRVFSQLPHRVWPLFLFSSQNPGAEITGFLRAQGEGPSPAAAWARGGAVLHLCPPQVQASPNPSANLRRFFLLSRCNKFKAPKSQNSPKINLCRGSSSSFGERCFSYTPSQEIPPSLSNIPVL